MIDIESAHQKIQQISQKEEPRPNSTKKKVLKIQLLKFF